MPTQTCVVLQPAPCQHSTSTFPLQPDQVQRRSAVSISLVHPTALHIAHSRFAASGFLKTWEFFIHHVGRGTGQQCVCDDRHRCSQVARAESRLDSDSKETKPGATEQSEHINVGFCHFFPFTLASKLTHIPQIKVQDSEGGETFFKIKQSTKLGKLMSAYAERTGRSLCAS